MIKTNEPVVPDQDLFDLGYRSSAAANRTDYFNWTFSWALYGYWGLVVLIGMINRAVQYARHRRSPQPNLIRGKVIERKPGSIISRTQRAIRRSLLMPLAFGNKHKEPLRWASPPTRTEGLLVAIYIVMNIVFCFPGYHLFEGNLK